jgi:hypothetical protein
MEQRIPPPGEIKGDFIVVWLDRGREPQCPLSARLLLGPASSSRRPFELFQTAREFKRRKRADGATCEKGPKLAVNHRPTCSGKFEDF